MTKKIPNYWKAIIKMGHLTEKDYWEKVEPSHILTQRAKERQKKRLIEEIFDDLDYIRKYSNKWDYNIPLAFWEIFEKWQKRNK